MRRADTGLGLEFSMHDSVPSISQGGVTMKINRKILIYLILFAIFDTVIPVPLTAIMLIYVLLEKPGWFAKLVEEIYKT